jgi:hypothetical protein
MVRKMLVKQAVHDLLEMGFGFGEDVKVAEQRNSRRAGRKIRFPFAYVHDLYDEPYEGQAQYDGDNDTHE